jgi:hypothetical protein
MTNQVDTMPIDLTAINTLEDALQIMEKRYGTILDTSDALGDGFAIVEKDTLVGVDHLIVDFQFHDSTTYTDGNGNPARFVSVAAITKHREKVRYNDGGSGVYGQLAEFMARTGREGGLRVKGGLHKSEYTNAAGQRGVTFYLS